MERSGALERTPPLRGRPGSRRLGGELLLQILDADEGARRVGELGIGCNPGIDRYTRNVYFDEKMNGTVHVALGRGFSYIGGTNESAIHWGIVKDLQSGGRIEFDGETVQKRPLGCLSTRSGLRGEHMFAFI